LDRVGYWDKIKAKIFKF